MSDREIVLSSFFGDIVSFYLQGNKTLNMNLSVCVIHSENVILYILYVKGINRGRDMNNGISNKCRSLNI